MWKSVGRAFQAKRTASAKALGQGRLGTKVHAQRHPQTLHSCTCLTSQQCLLPEKEASLDPQCFRGRAAPMTGLKKQGRQGA